MVNKLKDIVNKLDGYSCDNQGFAVTSLGPAGANGGSGTSLRVKPYLKNEESKGMPEEELLEEMTIRLLSRDSDAPHYAVYRAEKVNGGFWDLSVQEIQEKTGDLKEMTTRLLSRYSDAPHYEVYKAAKVNGFWELTVREIQDETEDKADEL